MSQTHGETTMALCRRDRPDDCKVHRCRRATLYIIMEGQRSVACEAADLRGTILRTSLAKRLGKLSEARDRQVLKVDVWFSAAWAPWSQCGAILLRHVASGQSAEATILDHSRHLDVHTPIPIASYTKLARCPRGTWRAIDPFAANRYCTLTYSRG